MKKSIYTLLLLITHFIYSQDNVVNDIVQYNYSLYSKDFDETQELFSELYIAKDCSNYVIYTSKQEVKNGSIMQNNESHTEVSTVAKYNDIQIYKKLNNIYLKEILITKDFYIVDSVSVFQWKIHNEYKDILGYKCQKATMNFRGRDYTAFFNTQLQISGGPWKFDGLPGLIMEINSNDGDLKINAIKLALNMKNSKLTISNPFKDKNFISWTEYKKKYREKYGEIIQRAKSKNMELKIPKKDIEVYFEDNE